jgi:hypothetical protein
MSPIWRAVFASIAGDGASSMSFWCRLWIEHSRSPRWMQRPWASASTWTSMCRGRTTSFSRKYRVVPEGRLRLALRLREERRHLGRGLDRAHAPSAPACGSLQENRIADALGVLPPPPSRREAVATPEHGTPARVISSREPHLVPHRLHRGHRRPDERHPASPQARAKAWFSERKP